METEPKCDKCGAEITTGAMALFCEHGKDCEFWVPEVEEFKADLEPMLFGDEYQEDMDEFEEALQNCCGHFEADGVFWCGAAGSEDCDWECPFSRDIGLTLKQIEERDAEEDKHD